GPRDGQDHVVVEEERDATVDGGAAASGHAVGAEVALGERAGRRGGGRRPAVLRRRDVLQVRPAQGVKEGVGAVEAVAGEGLLVAEPPLAVAERDVVLARHVTDDDPVEHQALPLFCCSRSMLSKSARKLPAPKPLSPLRWMISKKNGPAALSLYKPADSLRK